MAVSVFAARGSKKRVKNCDVARCVLQYGPKIVRMASLDGHDRVAALEREAGELSAIFATIAMKVATRLNNETPPKKRRN